jgi:regulator-associated protein of mTOR
MKKIHRSYINQVFSILTSLYELVVDPHLEVSTTASTVVDFIVAMLFESPFSRIQGTTVRGTPTLISSRARRQSVSTSNSATISRQPSMTNMAVPPSLNPTMQPLTRTESESQISTRSSFPGLMRTSSIASALGSLAGLALGTQSTANTAPPSPSLSQHSDVEMPPAPALNLAQYQSPYPLYTSPEASIIPATPSSYRSSFYSSRSASPVLNGPPPPQQESLPITNRYTPANIISGLIVKDLMRFSRRRILQDQPIPGNQRYLWHDLNIDGPYLDRLSDLGLDVGIGLNQTLPLKSRLYDWCLEYYKEPQMRVSRISLLPVVQALNQSCRI